MPYGQYGMTGLLPQSGQTGYQGQAENYLGAAGNAFANPYGQQFAGMGQGLLSQYYTGTVPAMNQARAAAAYRPDMVSQAATAAQMTSDQARGTLTRQLGRMGINPNSGKFAGLLQEANLSGAANKAGVMTRAEHAERQSQFGDLMAAAGLGQQLPSLAMGAFNNAQPSGGGLLGVAGAYGSLAGGKAQLDTTQKAFEGNASQNRIDQLMQEIQGMQGESTRLESDPITSYNQKYMTGRGDYQS